MPNNQRVFEFVFVSSHVSQELIPRTHVNDVLALATKVTFGLFSYDLPRGLIYKDLISKSR